MYDDAIDEIVLGLGLDRPSPQDAPVCGGIPMPYLRKREDSLGSQGIVELRHLFRWEIARCLDGVVCGLPEAD
jgi:hypothetical protein